MSEDTSLDIDDKSKDPPSRSIIPLPGMPLDNEEDESLDDIRQTEIQTSENENLPNSPNGPNGPNGPNDPYGGRRRKYTRRGRRSSKKRGTKRKQKRRQRRASRRAY